MHEKEGQRAVRVMQSNFEGVLSDFIDGKYRFASTPEQNDLWLSVTLESSELDESFVYVILAILGKRYRRLRDARVVPHC